MKLEEQGCPLVLLHTFTCRLEAASLHLRRELFPRRCGQQPACSSTASAEFRMECAPVQVAVTAPVELYLPRECYWQARFGAGAAVG